MSRVGKALINIPEKVLVQQSGNVVNVKGPKGELKFNIQSHLKLEIANNILEVKNTSDASSDVAMWGTTRAILSNMVEGVSKGFTKSLEFNGVGYKAAVANGVLTLSLGYSHNIDYKLPVGIAAVVNKNVIDITGCDKELVGFVASTVRSYRPPEPYKGKGLKYTTETIIRKAGKTGGKK